MSTTTTDDDVHLSFPGTTSNIRLARLTAASLAGDLGFDVDSIEDLRVAIDELCAAVVEAGAGSIELSYRPNGDSLEIMGRAEEVSTDELGLHPVARELVSMLADDHELSVDGDAAVFRLRKRRSTGDHS